MAERTNGELQMGLTVFSVFSRLNTGAVYLKLDLVEPAFLRGPEFVIKRGYFSSFYGRGNFLVITTLGSLKL